MSSSASPAAGTWFTPETTKRTSKQAKTKAKPKPNSQKAEKTVHKNAAAASSSSSSSTSSSSPPSFVKDSQRNISFSSTSSSSSIGQQDGAQDISAFQDPILHLPTHEAAAFANENWDDDDEVEVEGILVDTCAVNRAGQVTPKVVQDAITLYRELSNYGQKEDVEIVLVKNVTVGDVLKLVDRLGSELKGLKMYIQDGKLIIMECSSGKKHGLFVARISAQIVDYAVSTPFAEETFLVMNHALADELQARNPDVSLLAGTAADRNDLLCRVVVEVEHMHRSVPKLRIHGRQMFQDGDPYLVCFIAIKIYDIAPEDPGSRVCAVCYRKEGGTITVTDAVSFGSQHLTRNALHHWTKPMSQPGLEGLPPVRPDQMQIALHPAAAELVIPLRSLCIGVFADAGVFVEGNGAELATRTGNTEDLRIDLRSCYSVIHQVFRVPARRR